MNKFFYILYPIIMMFGLYTIDNLPISYRIFGQLLTIDFTTTNKLIAYGLIIVVIVANYYAIIFNKKLLIGNVYFLFTIFTLFAGDIFSMFLGLELMTISASLMLFSQENPSSYKFTKRYFFTHLAAASLILVGITYISAYNDDQRLMNLIQILPSNDYTKIIYFITLVGLLINIAAFPFSGWLLDIYPNSNNSSFIYLINFTTKINLILLYKLFSGLAMLKFLGILMIIYSAIYIYLEINIKRMFCYLILNNIGISLIAISSSFTYFYEYLFMDILYKTLLALFILSFIDNNQTTQLTNKVSKTNLLILLSGWIGIIPFLGLESIDFTTCIKHLITDNLSNKLQMIIYITNMVNLFGILSSKLFFTKNNENNIASSSYYNIIKQAELEIRENATSYRETPTGNIHNFKSIDYIYKIPLLCLSIFIVIINVIISKNYPNISCHQSIILTLSVVGIISLLALITKHKRINTLPLNLDILYIIYTMLNYFLFCYKLTNPLANKNNIIKGKFLMLKQYLNSLHSSTTSLFFIFILLIGFILSIYQY